jgi:N6-L-threonylcarbamoyladenine synthase
MPIILAIESSCDETAAAVCKDGKILSNIVSSQLDHEKYGGVIPELASRLHQQQVFTVVEAALQEAGIPKEDLDAIAFTQGPGLMGALMVGVSFAKGLSIGLSKPLIAVHHMKAHIMANFLSDTPPIFPFLCLTVSGGHTQLVLVRGITDMELLGETQDDAAGEAFDKGAKMLGLPYPGGHLIDKYAQTGNPSFHKFPISDVDKYSFSFSGIKTALLYFLQKNMKDNPEFIATHLSDICASYQYCIVKTLLDKVKIAAKETGVKHIALAGGVSANSELRRKFHLLAEELHMVSHIPAFDYCTDNAAMIAITGYFQSLAGDF